MSNSYQDDAATHTIDGEYIKEWLVLGPFPKKLDTDFLQAYGGEANIEPYEGMEIVAPNGGTLTWKRHQSKSDGIDLQTTTVAKRLRFEMGLGLQSELDIDQKRLSTDLRRAFETHGISLSANAMILMRNQSDNRWLITDSNNQPRYTIVREGETLLVYSNPQNAVAYAACHLHSPEAEYAEMVLGSYKGIKAWLNGVLIHTFQEEPVWKFIRLGLPLKKGENILLIKVGQYISGKYVAWSFRTKVEDEVAYRRSLELQLRVRRSQRDGKDVLTISASRVPKSSRNPKSTIWQIPTATVQIEIRDKASQPLRTLHTRTDTPVDWVVPDSAEGRLSIRATHTDPSGVTQEAEFTCQAHNILPVTPKIGHWETFDVTDGLAG